MIKDNYKKYIIYLLIFTIIFALDRITKIYILHLAEINNTLDIYITSFLNFYLIWNKGIAFGLLSFDEELIYNLITIIIILIIIVIIALMNKAEKMTKLGYLFIIGGAIGNFFDRIYYKGVPDFIELHVNNFHWFIFNIADIFITIGVLCLIYVEVLKKS